MVPTSGSSMGDIHTAFSIVDDQNLVAIDRYIAGQVPPQPTRRQVINEALREWAERNGLTHSGTSTSDVTKQD